MIPQAQPRSAEDDFTGTEPDALAGLARPHLVAMWPGGAAVAEMPSGGTVTVRRSRRSGLCVDHPSVSPDHPVFPPGSPGPVTVEAPGTPNATTPRRPLTDPRPTLPLPPHP